MPAGDSSRDGAAVLVHAGARRLYHYDLLDEGYAVDITATRVVTGNVAGDELLQRFYTAYIAPSF